AGHPVDALSRRQTVVLLHVDRERVALAYVVRNVRYDLDMRLKVTRVRIGTVSVGVVGLPGQADPADAERDLCVPGDGARGVGGEVGSASCGDRARGGACVG